MKLVGAKKQKPANPFFLSHPIDDVPGLVNSEIRFVIPPNIWTEAIIQTDSRFRLGSEVAALLKDKVMTAWNTTKRGVIKVHAEARLFHAIYQSKNVVLDKTVGVSKGCCFRCDIYLHEFNEEKWPSEPLRCSVASGNVHCMWMFPESNSESSPICSCVTAVKEELYHNIPRFCVGIEATELSIVLVEDANEGLSGRIENGSEAVGHR